MSINLSKDIKSVLLKVFFFCFIAGLFFINNSFAQPGKLKIISDLTEGYQHFPGGEIGIFQFLNENVRYPSKVRQKDISGTVWVSFVVDTTGNLKDIHINQSVDKDLDEEAIRVVNLMPKWIPLTENGKLIEYQFTMPFRFKLQ